MKCPICQNELEIKNKKVGETESGEAIFNEYGICRNCKKQWNLDKHRAKKADAANEKAPTKKEVKPAEETTKPASVEQSSKPKKRKKRPVVEDATKVIDKLPVLEEATVETAKSVEIKEIKPEIISEQPSADPVVRPKKKKRRPAPEAVAKVDINETEAVKPEEPIAQSEPAIEDTPAVPVARPKKKKRPVSPDAPVSEQTPAEPAARPKRKKRPAAEVVAAVESEVAIVSDDLANDKPVAKPKKKKRPASSDAPASERPVRVKKAAPAEDTSLDDFIIDLDVAEETVKKVPKKRKPIDNTKEEPTFSNIPPKHIREEREKEMRQNYQLMVDEDDEDDEGGVPTVLIVLLILLLLAAAAFAGYYFFLS